MQNHEQASADLVVKNEVEAITQRHPQTILI